MWRYEDQISVIYFETSSDTNGLSCNICFNSSFNRAGPWTRFLEPVPECSGQLAVPIGTARIGPDRCEPTQRWRDELGNRKREGEREWRGEGKGDMPTMASRGHRRVAEASVAPCRPGVHSSMSSSRAFQLRKVEREGVKVLDSGEGTRDSGWRVTGGCHSYRVTKWAPMEP